MEQINHRARAVALPRWIEWAMDLDSVRNWAIGLMLSAVAVGYIGVIKLSGLVEQAWPNMSKDASSIETMIFGVGYGAFVLLMMALPLIAHRRATRALHHIYATETGTKFVLNAKIVRQALSRIANAKTDPTQKLKRFHRTRRAAELLGIVDLNDRMEEYVSPLGPGPGHSNASFTLN